MRFFPHRGITVVAAGIALALGVYLYARLVGQVDLPTALNWAALGAAIGVVLAGLLVLGGGLGDARYLALADRYPEAFLAQSGPIPRVVSRVLEEFEPWVDSGYISGGSTVTSFSTTLVLDEAGASFWVGQRHPVRIVHVPWKDVAFLKLGEKRAPNRLGPAVDQLVLTAVDGDVVGTLTFPVERTDAWVPNRPYLQAHELEALVERAELLR